MRPLSAVALAALALVGCEPKVVEYKVNIVTTACDGTPLNQVTHLRVRVSGEGIAAPLEAVSSVSAAERQLLIPQIPAGKARVIEVRGYAGAPAEGGQVRSVGRSLPFEVPEVVPLAAVPVVVNVFLRQVDTFSQPSKAANPGACSRMLNPRAGHSATVLPNGKVFIAGGYQQSVGLARTALYKAEIYDPETGGFEEAPDIGLINSASSFTPLARAFHSASLLGNGQVLLWDGEEYTSGDVNGNSPTPRASVLVFDYERGEYGGVPFQNLSNIVRSHHAAARDASGKVVIVGGMTRAGQPAKSVVADKLEWYDPTTSVAKVIDGVSLARKQMSVAAVQDGAYIAVAGGSDGTAVKDEVSFFKYDSAAGVVVQEPLQTAPRLREARRSAAQATLNGSNDLLLIGGYSDATAVKPLSSTEVIATGTSFTVTEGPAITVARGDVCAAVLGDGRVLAVGGRTVDNAGAPPRSDGTVDLIVSQPGGVAVTLGKDSIKARYGHTCTTLSDGSVLVLGGVRELNNTFEVLQDALIFTPAPID